MKNSSIKKRVTLYYSVVLIIITVLVFGVFILTARWQTNLISKDTVMKSVQNSFDEIEYENDTIQIDNDFDSYHKGVTLLVYGENGGMIKGSAPAQFPSSTPLVAGDYREIKTTEDTWLVYDLYNTYENGQGLWVRGIYAMDNAASTLTAIMKVMLVMLPALLLIAILAGRRITKRAFDPVSEITAAADSINSGRDLSRRLPVGETRDELYYLSQTLNQMIGRLEDAFKAEKEFSSDVSHELKTPVSVILAECEYVLAETRTTDEYKESVETIQNQCRRTMSLIQQLLQVSRTVGAQQILDKENFDLSMLCNGIVEELSKMASDNGVALISDIQSNVSINADETLIMRMIINLVTNGIKYNGKKSSSYVKLSLKSDEKTTIIVEDNGIGIAKEDQTRVFNRFYKVDKSRRPANDSFGLGLSMVKWIAEAHGGSVGLESVPGIGSKFTVIL